MDRAALTAYAAVVLAGGRATRLGGFDKASVEVEGRSLLAHALEAVVDAVEVVVVGEEAWTDRPVTFVLEDPRHGGPVAGLLTGVESLLRRTPWLAVLAVDMPRVTTATFRRLREAAVGHDGAVLVDPGGRRQPVLVVDRERLDAVAPDREARHDHPLHRLLDRLDLAEVPSVGREHRDVDTWADLRDLGDLGDLAD